MIFSQAKAVGVTRFSHFMDIAVNFFRHRALLLCGSGDLLIHGVDMIDCSGDFVKGLTRLLRTTFTRL